MVGYWEAQITRIEVRKDIGKVVTFRVALGKDWGLSSSRKRGVILRTGSKPKSLNFQMSVK